MSTRDLAGLAQSLKLSRRITADDVRALRGLVFGDMTVAPGEMEALISLDEAVTDRAPEWTMFYVEALTDYIVRQQDVPGYVDEDRARWLISALSRDGRICGDSELEAVIRILETADQVPPSLGTFALDQVRLAVLEDGRITAAEVALLRRILYSTAGEGNIAITRAEGELLFDINDAVRGKPNDPSWPDLFSKALAACVMTVSGYRTPPREEAAHREAWLAAPADTGLGSFIGRMFTGAPQHFSSLSAVKRAMAVNDPIADDVDADEAARHAAELVNADEAGWLAARIGRDGDFDDAEQALVSFLKRESPEIHPALKPLMDKLAARRA